MSWLPEAPDWRTHLPKVDPAQHLRDELVRLLNRLEQGKGVRNVGTIERQRYREQVAAVSATVLPGDLPLLLRIVRLGATFSGSMHAATQTSAIVAARAIVRLAEENPTPELITALEALRTGLLNPNAPMAFLPVRLRLARLLKRLRNLPIPAGAPMTTSQELPLPAAVREENLP